MMRVLGFSRKWSKLDNNSFTTFRYPRLDKDWEVGELVQAVLNPRSPKRQVLGEARIIKKEQRVLDSFFTGGWGRLYHGRLIPSLGAPLVTEAEVIADGFKSREEMVAYMKKTYGPDYISYFHKLTLRWEHRGCPEREGG